MSKTTALYHIVFCTKSRSNTIPTDYKTDLYRFIWNEIRKLNSNLIRIGGVQNHLHLLIDLQPSIALSTLVRNIKANSSGWLRKDNRFPLFEGWGAEYYASTISPDNKDTVINYIATQETHHQSITDDEEFRELHSHSGLPYDEATLL